MKKKLLLFTLGSLFLFCTCQSKKYDTKNYEPQILILSPNEVVSDKAFRKKIEIDNKEIKERLKQKERESAMNSDETEKQFENIAIMKVHEKAFSEHIDLPKTISFISEQYLAYNFFEKFPKIIILLKDLQCNGQINELKKTSEEHGLRYVLNFPKVEFFKDSIIHKVKIRVQLYDHITHSIVLEQDYIGDSVNPGNEFACPEGSFSCTINNALAKALPDVISIVESNTAKLTINH
jgi:hypothetical protein